jgi:hypothetical protein
MQFVTCNAVIKLHVYVKLFAHVMPNLDCTYRSRVLFTSRSASPEGIQLSGDCLVTHSMLPLPQPAAAALLSSGLQPSLTSDQLNLGLSYCSGLPLALQLVNAALRDAADPSAREAVLTQLASKGPIIDSSSSSSSGSSSSSNNDSLSLPARDVLTQQLQASIELLPPDLRSTWLDLVLLMDRQGVSLLKLQCVFGSAALHLLQERRLISISMRRPGSDLCDVVVDGVMLAVARSVAAKGTQQYRMTADTGAAMVGGKLLPDGPYTVRRVKTIFCVEGLSYKQAVHDLSWHAPHRNLNRL